MTNPFLRAHQCGGQSGGHRRLQLLQFICAIIDLRHIIFSEFIVLNGKGSKKRPWEANCQAREPRTEYATRDITAEDEVLTIGAGNTTEDYNRLRLTALK